MRVETLDDLAAELDLPELDLDLYNTNFVGYFNRRPGTCFYRDGSFDPDAVVLYERDLQDEFDSVYHQRTGKRPFRKLSFRDSEFMLRSYAVEHDLPVVRITDADSPLTSVGMIRAFAFDLRRAMKLAQEAASDYDMKKSMKKQSSRLGLRGYIGVGLAALIGTAGALFGAYNLIESEVERRVASYKAQFQDTMQDYFVDESGNPSPEMQSLVDHLKDELKYSTRSEIEAYFEVEYVDGRPVFNEDVERFLSAAQQRADHDVSDFIERLRTDDELRDRLVESFVDALLDG